MDSAAVEQIVALGTQPISEASPVGDPVRYEPEFEQLQGQMDRIGSLSGETPDWGVVVNLSTSILKAKSKDLLVLTYLSIGLFERDGYDGLAAAFKTYTEFLGKFWEHCFPKVKPPHGRKNAVQYLVDKVLDSVEPKDGKRKREPETREKAAVHACADAVTALDDAVTKAFTGQPETPNTIPLTRAFKALREKVGPLVTAAPPAAAASAEGAASSGGAPSAGPSMGGGAPEAFTTATQAVQAVVRVAKYLISQDNKDARGYRLIRAVHFGGLAEPPKDKIIPGPPPPRRQFFEKLASDGNWPQLLTDAEGQFATTPLWLDMQRYAALALKGLGPAYKAAYDAVVLETVALQSRLPELFNLSFKDGTGFADGSTKAWLSDVGAAFGGGGGGGGASGDAIDQAVNEARKLLSESKSAEAVGRLSSQVEGSGSRRSRFRAQLALAELCVDLNKPTLALSILEGLEGTIEQYHVEDWEPELAGGVYRSLYDCLQKAKPKPTPEDVARISAVFGRLCRMDPATAFKLDGLKAKAPA